MFNIFCSTFASVRLDGKEIFDHLILNFYKFFKQTLVKAEMPPFVAT